MWQTSERTSRSSSTTRMRLAPSSPMSAAPQGPIVSPRAPGFNRRRSITAVRARGGRSSESTAQAQLDPEVGRGLEARKPFHEASFEPPAVAQVEPGAHAEVHLQAGVVRDVREQARGGARFEEE